MGDGAGRLEMLARDVNEPASLQLSWSSLMGAQLPAVERISVPDRPPLSPLGASSAVLLLARACRDATRAAARYAVAERTDTEISAELGRAARRLRALRERWIPQQEQALAQFDLALTRASANRQHGCAGCSIAAAATEPARCSRRRTPTRGEPARMWRPVDRWHGCPDSAAPAWP